jgi:hypothetical protein
MSGVVADPAIFLISPLTGALSKYVDAHRQASANENRRFVRPWPITFSRYF